MLARSGHAQVTMRNFLAATSLGLSLVACQQVSNSPESQTIGEIADMHAASVSEVAGTCDLTPVPSELLFVDYSALLNASEIKFALPRDFVMVLPSDGSERGFFCSSAAELFV